MVLFEAVLIWELLDAGVAASMVAESKSIVKTGRGYGKKYVETERKAFVNGAYPTIGPLSAIVRKITAGRYLHDDIAGKPSKI